MITLRATAGTATRAHHDLRAVHTVLAAGAKRILADRHQGLAAGGSLDAGVTQVWIAAGRTSRRIADGQQRRRVMRERRCAREGRPECRILGEAWWTAQWIACEPW